MTPTTTDVDAEESPDVAETVVVPLPEAVVVRVESMDWDWEPTAGSGVLAQGG